MANNILTDSDLLNLMAESLETDYYTFGAYTDYNDLDIPNLKVICLCDNDANNP